MFFLTIQDVLYTAPGQKLSPAKILGTPNQNSHVDDKEDFQQHKISGQCLSLRHINRTYNSALFFDPVLQSLDLQKSDAISLFKPPVLDF
jgi:hypothetical protein